MKIRNPFTIVMPYYENSDMLKIHLAYWANYPEEIKEFVSICIVDDGSPTKPASESLSTALTDLVDFNGVSLFQIKKDIPWNQNGARNLAMMHVNGWAVSTDMDHVLTAEDARAILVNKVKKDYCYRPLRKRVDGSVYKRHPNSYLIHSDLYWTVGGYDESYAGYYGTDSTFRKRLSSITKVMNIDFFSLMLYGRDDVHDASTNPLRYGRKGTSFHVSSNPVLSQRKKENPQPIPPINFDWIRLI